jgi:hypothetical protein
MLVFAIGTGLLTSATAMAGPKGEFICRNLGSLEITIDGDFSEWPLDQYLQRSEQPVFPGAKTAASTDASGDHIVFAKDRIGLFNDTQNTPSTFSDGIGDFDSVIYVAWNQECLYFLEVCVDDVLKRDRNPGNCVGLDVGNDGFSIFIDAKNDSDDCAATGATFDNVDDFELGAGLHSEHRLDDQDSDDLGARQHVERHGTPSLIDSPCPGPATYRGFLDALPFPDIAARAYADLGAAGALNPVILNNPGQAFSGYALEVCVPFGFYTDFDPSLNPVMGFELFWHEADLCGSAFGCSDAETDLGPGPGSNAISWATWAQSTDVFCNGEVGLFHTKNWGEIRFDDTNPFSSGGFQLPSDMNQDGALDLADAVGLLRHLFSNNPLTVPCEGGSIHDAGNIRLLDHNGDSVVDVSDPVALLLWIFQGGSPHPLAVPGQEGTECVQIGGCADSIGCQ